MTAIPELLEMVAVEGGLVTLDAMGCQTVIATQFIDQGADYVTGAQGESRAHLSAR